MQTFVFDTLEEVGKKTLEYLNGPDIAISGGGTYAELFEIWKKELLKRGPEVKNLNFYPVDERRVGFDESGNNWKVAFDKLFAPLGIREQKDNMGQSAAQFQSLLKSNFGDRVVFDQIYLGMGDDGHTASLFPGDPALEDTDSLVLETNSPKPPVPRVTLGLRIIWDARDLITVVLGGGKASLVKRLLDGDMSLPITRAMKGHANPILILDKAAAAQI